MTQPTRTDIINTLAAHAGEGKVSMENAVRNLMTQYEMTEDQKSRVIADLPSYWEYQNEL